MSDFFDRLVADMTKGAAETEGFIRGGRVAVQAAHDPQGFEQKLAAAAPPPIPIRAHGAEIRRLVKKRQAEGLGDEVKLPGLPPVRSRASADVSPKLGHSYAQGAEDALDAFGVKQAFLGAVLPMAASFLGGSALKKGLGWAAGKFLPGAKGIGGMVGNVARKGMNVLNKGGIGADAMNMGANMGAAEVANRFVNPGQ